MCPQFDEDVELVIGWHQYQLPSQGNVFAPTAMWPASDKTGYVMNLGNGPTPRLSQHPLYRKILYIHHVDFRGPRTGLPWRIKQPGAPLSCKGLWNTPQFTKQQSFVHPGVVQSHQYIVCKD